MSETENILKEHLSKVDSNISKLRYVKPGDWILSSDHNDLVDTVKSIRDLLSVIIGKIVDLEREIVSVAIIKELKDYVYPSDRFVAQNDYSAFGLPRPPVYPYTVTKVLVPAGKVTEIRVPLPYRSADRMARLHFAVYSDGDVFVDLKFYRVNPDGSLTSVGGLLADTWLSKLGWCMISDIRPQLWREHYIASIYLENKGDTDAYAYITPVIVDFYRSLPFKAFSTLAIPPEPNTYVGPGTFYFWFAFLESEIPLNTAVGIEFSIDVEAIGEDVTLTMLLNSTKVYTYTVSAGKRQTVYLYGILLLREVDEWLWAEVDMDVGDRANVYGYRIRFFEIPQPLSFMRW